MLHYTLPHELRSPLSGMMGFAELLLDAGSLSPAEMREMAHLLQQNSRHLYRLLENYLLYAQIDLIAKDQEMVRALQASRTGDANASVREIAGHTAVVYGREDDLQLFLDEVAPQLALRREDWQKIVSEVVDNAFKFSSPGTAVLVGAGLGEGAYLLSVQNSGQGMAPEQVRAATSYVPFREKVYQPQTTNAGMGLAIVRSLAELYAGSFHLQSQPAASTRAYVRLPLAPDQG
jgi:signal transduction histidine kinase